MDYSLTRHSHNEYSLTNITLPSHITYTDEWGFDRVIFPHYDNMEHEHIEKITYKKKIKNTCKKIKNQVVLTGCICYGLGMYTFHSLIP